MYCDALRGKTHLRGFLIAGVTLLLVGLAGNARAIPVSTPDDGDAGMRAWNWTHEPGNDEAVRFFDWADRGPNRASPNAFRWFRSVPTQNWGERWELGSSSFHQGRLGAWNSRHMIDGLPTTRSPLTGQDRFPAGVPDGGSTAMMMGGAFCGLVLLVKRLRS
jgi:hypothetical protein